MPVSYTHLDVYKRQRYGHFSARKCANVLKESCIFKNMERRVRKVLRVCDLCQKSKVVNYRVEGEMNYIKVDVYKRQRLLNAYL